MRLNLHCKASVWSGVGQYFCHRDTETQRKNGKNRENRFFLSFSLWLCGSVADSWKQSAVFGVGQGDIHLSPEAVVTESRDGVSVEIGLDLGPFRIVHVF